MKHLLLLGTLVIFSFRMAAQSVTIMPNGKVEQAASSASLALIGVGVPEINVKKSLGTLANPTSVTFNNALFQLDASGYNGTEYTSPRSRIRLATSEVWSSIANGTKIQFYTTANGETSLEERFRITDRGLIGVGTIAPAGRVDVVHASSVTEPTLRLFETEPSTPSRIHFANEGYDSYWYLNAQHGLYGVNKFSIGSSTLADVFYISSLGRVGINQSNPETRLHLTDGNFTVDNTEPKILLKRTSTSKSTQLVFYKPDNSEGAEIIQEGSDLFMHTGNINGEGLSISSSNLIGIGTDSPSYGLHIAKAGESTGATSGIVSIGSATNHHMNLDGNEIDAYTYLNTGNKLYLNANSQENVEIGKTSGTGNLVANNYTQLGNDAPKIKQKLIEGTTHASNSSTQVPHGLDFHKIISVEVYIYKEAHNIFGEAYYPSGGGLYTYYYQFNATNITLLDVNTNLKNQPYKVLVTYKD